MLTGETVLVTGATGQQGGAVAHRLLREGQKVRVLTRKKEKTYELQRLGAEVAEGNLTDPISLKAALAGVKKVFLVTTPFEEGMGAEVQQGITMADAARAAGVDHLVYTSVASVDRNTGIPHFETKRKVEQYIQKIGIVATILRPVFFMENFLAPWLLSMIKEGKVILPIRSDCPLQMISLEDIGAFGAAAFIRPKEFIWETIELAGDSLTLPEAIQILSQATEKKVLYAQLPDDQAEGRWGPDFAKMFRWFNEAGYNVNIPGLQARYGIPLTTYKDFVAKAVVSKSLV